jgi:hypothetical protein
MALAFSYGPLVQHYVSVLLLYQYAVTSRVCSYRNYESVTRKSAAIKVTYIKKESCMLRIFIKSCE